MKGKGLGPQVWTPDSGTLYVLFHGLLLSHNFREVTSIHSLSLHLFAAGRVTAVLQEDVLGIPAGTEEVGKKGLPFP